MTEPTKMIPIEFFDEESKETAYFIVRRCGDHVPLCLLLESGADIEVSPERVHAERVLRALEDALRD